MEVIKQVFLCFKSLRSLHFHPRAQRCQTETNPATCERFIPFHPFTRHVPVDTPGGWIHFSPMNFTESRWAPIVLLTCSNVFMTVAWYGHLKFKGSPLLLVILASWGIAFFEYILMVPANRWGNAHYSATQLKIMQEVITLAVFCGFAVYYLGERIRWNHIAAFVCILAAVAFTFLPKE